LGWGPSHCELRVTGGGVKIIEINPRLAGGYIPELVRLAFGIDMIAETIKLVVGHQPSLKKTKSAYSSIRFIIPDKEGTLIRVDNLDNAARLSGIVEARLYSSVRDVIHRHDDFRSRVGHVIAVAGSAETSRAAAEEARGMIGLVIEAESGGTSSEAN
jgi:biotin carboxylase